MCLSNWCILDQVSHMIFFLAIWMKFHIGCEKQFRSLTKISFCFQDSDEADALEDLKKTFAAEQAKMNKRRQKFQAQDSVLVEPLGKSMEE